jgi:hypothetical protein
MSRASCIALAVICSSPTLAKPWKGITPGANFALDVLGILGEPSKKVPSADGTIWVYGKSTAVAGTSQVQVRFDSNQLVTRVDVYPLGSVARSEVEKAYGPACTTTLEGCYVKKASAAGHTYFVYASLGLAVFFLPDGDRVKNLTYLPSSKSP